MLSQRVPDTEPRWRHFGAIAAFDMTGTVSMQVKTVTHTLEPKMAADGLALLCRNEIPTI